MKILDKWAIATVGEECVIRNDLRMPISIEERKKIEGTYPYYGPTGILGFINEFRVHGKFALIGEDGDHFLKYKTKSQTLLVNEKFNVNNHAHVIGDSKTCLAEWFYVYFQHKNLEKYLTRQGAGRYKLTKQSLSDIPILLPPIEEQKAIASILSTWDEAIEKTERLISLKQDYHKKLFRKLIQKADSFVLEKRMYKLEELVEKQKGKMVLQNNDFKGRPYIGSISFEGAFNTYTESTDGVECNHDDVIMLWDGENAGKVATGLNGIVSSTVCTLKLNENINNNYLCIHLQMNESKIRAIREGSGIPHIPGDFLSWYHLLLPSMDMQKKIGQIARSSEKEIQLLKKVLNKLKEQKQGLMQKLLTGKWRVNFKEEK